jgi:hypothetical protein
MRASPPTGRADKPVTLFAPGARFMAVPGVMAAMTRAGVQVAPACLTSASETGGLGHAVSRSEDLAPAPYGARADKTA